MKTILVVVGTLGLFTTPALAGASKKKPAAPATQVKKPAFGESFDLAPRRAALPRESETVEAPVQPKALGDAQLAAVIDKRLPDIEHCWNKLPQRQRVEACTALLDLTVEPNGSVSAIEIGGDVPAGAHRCITRAVARWKFPTADDQSKVEYGIALRSL
jgi:hypothetical protein